MRVPSTDLDKSLGIFASKGLVEMSTWRASKAKFQLKSFLLAEAYIRNDDIDWLEVFEKIKLGCEGNLSGQDWLNYRDEIGIDFEIVTGHERIGGYFDLNDQLIKIQFTPDILEFIKTADKKDLKKLAKNFWINFCHEDTHRQQFLKAGEDHFNYKAPSSLDWNVDIGENLEYFDQSVEADAYGREIGARLKTMHPRKTVSQLFLSINSNLIKDTYCKHIINIYRDPRISEKANHAFFRALYDHLESNEIV